MAGEDSEALKRVIPKIELYPKPVYTGNLCDHTASQKNIRNFQKT